MKTIKQVEVQPVYIKHLPNVSEMEEGKVYISKEYHVSGHRCLCGCGEFAILPFDLIINGEDKGWQLTEDASGRITLTPSIGNYQLDCKSHYIITKNKANFV